MIVLNGNLAELWKGSADASVGAGMVLRNPAALCLGQAEISAMSDLFMMWQAVQGRNSSERKQILILMLCKLD